MRLLLLVLSLSLMLSLPGCKKAPESAPDTVEGEEKGDVAAAGDDESETKRKPRRKGRRKRDKEKVKPVAPEVAPTEVPAADVKSVPDAAPRAPDAPVVEAGEPAPDRQPAPAAEAKLPTVTTRRLTPPPVRVAVARLLTVVDVNKYLKEKGWIAYGPVQGIPPSEFFNSLLYRKPGTNKFVTLLVWDFPQFAQALEKFHELQATYPNAEELKEMFTKFIFFSYRNNVSTLGVLHEGSSFVFAVSCHNEVCDDTALYELAKTIYGRIQ